MDDARPSPRPRPGPGSHRSGAAEDSPTDGTTRRWFLVGAGAVVVGAAGGTGIALVRHHDGSPAPRPAPAALVAAAARERQLIADLDATTGGDAALRRVLVRTRADHAAHLAAFEALLAGYDPQPGSGPSARSSRGASAAAAAPTGAPRTAAQLRAAETAAATTSALAASSASGRLAVLLASVSASESTHAAVIR